MLYIKCDTRDMNYAVNLVWADELKAQGTLRPAPMKIYNEFQVHRFLTEEKKTSINANFSTFFFSAFMNSLQLLKRVYFQSATWGRSTSNFVLDCVSSEEALQINI